MSDTPAILANASPLNRYGEMCAEVYVLDKPPGALGDIEYYREALGRLEGPFLEAACGSGRLMIPMLEAGFDVHGFDHSEHMLAQCRSAADERGLPLKVQRSTYQDFAFDQPFGAIVSPVGSFTLVDDYDAALAALRRFHECLRPGGRLFVDIMPLGYLTARPLDYVRSWTTPSGDLLRIVSNVVELDLLAQRRVSQDRYERWRGGRLVEQELEVLAVRSWALKEFELTLKEAGFAEISVCADYRVGRPPGARAGYWCFQAVKPG
ncbi:MAG TPA: class I SAM-dependent methyltransferase [Caulobacteraceae bacterium]|jgi:SAM-dependent methyltransferase|nr:class I SAM-dependent methyltransferase [Caulobacteraceae bacterium]